jgi:predicted  nucleic acid-binding Zn-ribbon protein
MSELMQAMLDLNAIDRRIVRGKIRLQELTRAVAAQEKAVEDARVVARGFEQAIKEKAFSADRLNMEIRTAEAEAGDQERKLKSIKNQREFRIVTDRIKDLKIRVDEHESAVLNNMSELDALREKMAAAHTKVGEEDLKLTTARQTAQEEVNGIKAKHAALLEERQAAVLRVQHMDASAYQAYDLALKRTKGDPIAEMTADGICQSCFIRQNSNVVNLVHIGNDVKNCRCHGCGRILYIKNAPEEEAAEQ